MNYIRQCRLFVVLFMMLCLGLISFQTQAAPKAKPKAAQKERLVLMPLRLGAEDQQLQGAMEMALVKGLQQRYEVFFGEQVAKKAREIFMKESRNTAKKECDETRCLQGIAEAFQAELLATANITKQDGGYFIALSVQNLFDNKVVQSESIACKGCDSFAVIEKLKELVGTSMNTVSLPETPKSLPNAIALPSVPVAPHTSSNANDADSQTWVEVVKGNTIEDYKLYLESYPQGKYAKLAMEQKGKLEAYAEVLVWAEVVKGNSIEDYNRYLHSYPQGKYAKQAMEQNQKLAAYTKAKEEASAAQQEDQAWNSVQQGNSESSYISFLKQYPSGRYAALAKLKMKKAIQAAAEAEVQKRREAEEQQKKVLAAYLAQNPFLMAAIPGKSYELGKNEVTQKEWQVVMGNNPSYFTSCGDNCPVEQVSWDDIQIFLQKLNAKTGRQYRLPTEAEWEYACYGGSKTEYCGSKDIDSVAWYNANSNSTAHPVGQKQANGYGLYDMSGNVWEWMQDEFNGRRALRGGAWYDGSSDARAAYRFGVEAADRYNIIGFRLARTLP